MGRTRKRMEKREKTSLPGKKKPKRLSTRRKTSRKLVVTSSRGETWKRRGIQIKKGGVVSHRGESKNKTERHRTVRGKGKTENRGEQLTWKRGSPISHPPTKPPETGKMGDKKGEPAAKISWDQTGVALGQTRPDRKNTRKIQKRVRILQREGQTMPPNLLRPLYNTGRLNQFELMQKPRK